MGHRSTSETLAQIFVAFLEQRTWSQAALARRCGVDVKAVRKRLSDLSRGGMPLQSELDHPHVYWSVPRNWYPNGKLLEPKQAALVARLLNRLPRSADRARALCAVLDTEDVAPRDDGLRERASAVLTTLEDAACGHHVANIDYYTVSRGDRGTRDVSVHRILYGDRDRVVAM